MHRRLKIGLFLVPVLAGVTGFILLPRGGEAAGPAGSQPAPELTGGAWLNTPGGKPVRLADRRGRVTVLHFWTYG